MSVARRELHSGWTLRPGRGAPSHLPREIAATVPGCVHTDLLAASLIADPFVDDNESAQRWIGLSDWTYRMSFSAQPDLHARHELVFHGLDTVAEVRVNGEAVLMTQNQHRTHRVEIGSRLRTGQNELEVSFTSPVRWANAQSARLGARPRPYPLPYEAIRKSASSFGWDWGIHTATSGIWRPVVLESWSIARLTEVRIAASPQETGGGRVRAAVTIERADPTADLTVTVSLDGQHRTVPVPAGEDRVEVELALADVQHWWPVGHGAQPLYDVDVTLGDGDATLDSRRRRIGFRTVEWDTTPDEHGTKFALRVNGRRVNVKGVNWIPDDALVSRVAPSDYRERLSQARDAHVNLVRVWGGGIYESEDFYDACDELGLLTWQDFLFACAGYPEEEPIRAEVEAEAREQIVRLSTHASLVLLCGNNENLMGYEEWGWQHSLDGASWGERYYFDLLPTLVAELAAHVPYIPGSPFNPQGGPANDERHGPTHLWEQWNRDDWRSYARHRPRFVAEFGWQGPPTWTTLVEAVHDDPLTPESPGMLVHQKAENGNAKLRDGLLAHAPIPHDFASWHWAMQWNQAAAVRFALEHFRALETNSGAIVWQLNDCWPVTSWSAIDSAGRLKPLWFALRRAFADRLIVVDREASTAQLVNDADTAWSGLVVGRRLRFDGTELARETAEMMIPARSAGTVPLSARICASADPRSEVIVVDVGDVRGWDFFAEPRDSSLQAARLDLRIETSEGGTILTATARTLVRDLTVLVDRAHPDATITDGMVTLLPGESASFRIADCPEPADTLRRSGVIRSLNDLVSGGDPRIDLSLRR